MPQNRKGLTNAAVADFSYATEEFVCGVDIMCGKMQGHVVLPLPTRYNMSMLFRAYFSPFLILRFPI